MQLSAFGELQEGLQARTRAFNRRADSPRCKKILPRQHRNGVKVEQVYASETDAKTPRVEPAAAQVEPVPIHSDFAVAAAEDNSHNDEADAPSAQFGAPRKIRSRSASRRQPIPKQ